MSLRDRITSEARAVVRREPESRSSIDMWLNQYLMPANEFSFNGNVYPFGLRQTLTNGDRTREISNTLPAYMGSLRTCPPAFAAQMVRALALSQARFSFRGTMYGKNRGKIFGNTALSILERPWTNGTTGELLSRMEWHAGLTGNSYVTSRSASELMVLRPDWVAIVYGSHSEPEDPSGAIDRELIGYIYQNGGLFSRYRPVTLLPDEVAHWSPLPDPEGAGVGMSWITPAIREIQGDRAATEHKLRYFEQGATPNLVVKGITAATADQFNEIVDSMEERHAGVRNAYRTLYLTAGADATIVGNNLSEMGFAEVQGRSETRIAMLSRVHPVVLAAAEGLQGSSLNSGNFNAARRIWADTWIYPTLQDLAASLSPLVQVPRDAELWPDVSDMPVLREDARDAADIEQVKAATIVSLINGGFKPDSVKAAVKAQDMSLLEHTGLVSVQLQPPGQQPPAAGAPAAQVALPAAPEQPAARSEDAEEPDLAAIRQMAERAAGHDTTPGHDELHHWWVYGPGLAKWAGSPEPWTTLVALLTPHVGKRKAEVYASRWFIEHFGFAAGSDLNRVTHGHPPRGHKVGPG